MKIRWLYEVNTRSYSAFIKKKQSPRRLTTAEYRGELLKRGYSVASWAREHEYKPSTVFDAIRGTSTGPQVQQILKQLNKEICA